MDEKERFKYTIRRVDHGVDMMPFPPEVMKHLQKNERVEEEKKTEQKEDELDDEMVMDDRSITSKELRGEFEDGSRRRAFNDANEDVMDYDVTFDYDMVDKVGIEMMRRLK